MEFLFWSFLFLLWSNAGVFTFFCGRVGVHLKQMDIGWKGAGLLASFFQESSYAVKGGGGDCIRPIFQAYSHHLGLQPPPQRVSRSNWWCGAAVYWFLDQCPLPSHHSPSFGQLLWDSFTLCQLLWGCSLGCDMRQEGQLLPWNWYKLERLAFSWSDICECQLAVCYVNLVLLKM